MLAKGKSMQEQAAELQKEQYGKNLDDELTALEHNLKTKKIPPIKLEAFLFRNNY